MPFRRGPKRKFRILIADREGVFRLGVKRLFGVEDDLRVVAQAENARQLKAAIKSFRPDLLFVQAEIVQEEPDDLLAVVRRQSPHTQTVVTGSAFSDDRVAQYVKAGASGVILKSEPPELFVKCARKVMNKGTWIPKPQVAAAVSRTQGDQPQPPRPAETLTRREKSVLAYLMQGCRNREIARYLSITEQTVKNHLRTIYDKVGVSDRLELVLYAIHKHLELPPADIATSTP